MNISRFAAPMLVLCSMFIVEGCTVSSGVLNHISVSGLAHKPDQFCDSADGDQKRRCTEQHLASISFVPWKEQAGLLVTGNGHCGKLGVDFGDGSPVVEATNVDLINGVLVPHTYIDWPGMKTVKAKGIVDCLGELSLDIKVGSRPDGDHIYDLGFGPTGSICAQVPGVSRIRKGSGLRISTNGGTINYGGGAVFNASGDASAVVPPNYFFPTHRKHSLIYRIGSQLIQGEAGSVVVVAQETNWLDICINDNPDYLNDNSGAMGIRIEVNERSAVP
jgi:hypothetical protein